MVYMVSDLSTVFLFANNIDTEKPKNLTRVKQRMHIVHSLLFCYVDVHLFKSLFNQA